MTAFSRVSSLRICGGQHTADAEVMWLSMRHQRTQSLAALTLRGSVMADRTHVHDRLNTLKKSL